MIDDSSAVDGDTLRLVLMCNPGTGATWPPPSRCGWSSACRREIRTALSRQPIERWPPDHAGRKIVAAGIPLRHPARSMICLSASTPVARRYRLRCVHRRVCRRFRPRI